MNVPLQRSYDSEEMDAIASNGQVVCDVCERVFGNAAGLAIHKGRSHGAKAKAPKAPKAPSEPAELVATVQRETRLRVECPCCRAMFTVEIPE